ELCGAVVARFPARADQRYDSRGDLLRFGGCASAAAANLQSNAAQPVGQLQPVAPLPEVWRLSGNERAEPFQLSRALPESAAAFFARPDVYQFLCLEQVN